VDGYLSTGATTKRVDLSEAVEQFIGSREPKTVANTFPNHAVCDLSREHVDAYIAGHGDVSARTRNGRRC
jgi:hypothetical protein